MSKIAVLFPGQGTQIMGMGRDFYDEFACSRAVFDQATDIRDLCFKGPEEMLNRTAQTQPALLVTETAMWQAFSSCIDEVYAVAGFSLGEYPALVAAGVLAFPEALALVRKRAVWMEEAYPQGGGMLAVIGVAGETLTELVGQVAAVQAGVVELVNFNAPGQIVAAGDQAALEVLAQLVQQQKGRAIALNVSGPFHSSLLASVAEKIRGELTQIELREPCIPVISNVTADYYVQNQISDLLASQVCHAVLWEQSIRRLLADGVDLFIELGPGKVLTGLLKKIDRQAKVVTVSSCADLHAFVREIL